VKLKNATQTKMSEKEKSTAKKYNETIDDYINKDVKSIIEILNSDVNIENIIEQQAEVFLQGVAVELISEL
jgi:transcription elongation factor